MGWMILKLNMTLLQELRQEMAKNTWNYFATEEGTVGKLIFIIGTYLIPAIG